MGSAKYVGRVGALAVAMGIGTALASPAWADTSSGDSGSTSSSESTSADPPSRTSKDRTTPSADDSPDETNSDDGDATEDVSEDTGEDDADSQADSTDDTDTDTDTDGDENAGDSDQLVEDSDDPAAQTDSAQPEPVVEDSSTEPAAGNSSEPEPEPEPAADENTSEEHSGTDNLTDSEAVVIVAAPAPVDEESESTGAQELAANEAAPAGVPAPAPLVRQPLTPIGLILGAPAALLNIAVEAINLLLSPAPTMPGDPPILLGVLMFVHREIHRTFFNSAPYAVADTATTREHVPTVIDVLGNDTDPNIDSVTGAGDVLTVTKYTQAANGTVVLNADGTFTYTPNANFSGTDTFRYTVSDEASPWHSHGLLSLLFRGGHAPTTTVTVTVTPDSAPVANDDTVSTDEDTALTIDPGQLLANDEDADSGPDDLVVVIVVSPTHGSLLSNSDGTFTYTPDENFNGTDTFSYVAANSATSNTATVTITVNAVNDAPTLTPDTPLTDSITGNVTADLGGADVDGDTLTYETTTPTRGSITVVDGVFTYTPTAEARAAVAQGGPATDTFTVTVSDGNGGTASQTVTVAIAPNIDNITIEVRWGAAPRDLDSHLTGPTTGDGQFHVYYGFRNHLNTDGSLAANLAADDTSSFGPEVTTIYTRTPGDFLFYVHSYSADGILATSEATVTVRDSVSGIDTQFAVSDTAVGRYWSVFTLNINETGIVTITALDEYSDTDPRLANAAIAV